MKTLRALLVLVFFVCSVAQARAGYRVYENEYYQGTMVNESSVKPLTFGVGPSRKLQETRSERFLNTSNALYSLGSYFSESKQSQLLNEQLKEQKLRNRILEEQIRNSRTRSKN